MGAFSFFSRGKDKGFLTLDIGTEAVKILAINKTKKGIALEGAALSYLDRFGVFDSRDLKKDVLKKAVLDALEEVRKASGRQLRKVILTLSPDILKARVVNREATNPREGKEICQGIITEAQKKICQEYARKTGILPADIHFIHSEILGIKIDGYRVTELKEHKGKKIEFSVFTVFLPKGYLQGLKEISWELDLQILKVVHPVGSLMRIFTKESGVFLDIGGEITQVALLDKGELKLVDEFEMGGKDFSQAISDEFGLTEEGARVLKERYSRGDLTEETRQRVGEIISSVSAKWLSQLKSTLKKHRELMPPDLYLFGGGSQLQDIKEILTDEEWEDIPFMRKPKVKFASFKDLPQLSPQYFNSILIGHYASKGKNI